jgi:hypothetical protein
LEVSVRFAKVSLGGLPFAISEKCVEQLLIPQPLQHLGEKKPPFLGAGSVEGKIVPVVDVGTLWSSPAHSILLWLLVRTERGALVVVLGEQPVWAEGELRSLDEHSGASFPFPHKHFRGLISFGDGSTLPLLDLACFLEEEDWTWFDRQGEANGDNTKRPDLAG